MGPVGPVKYLGSNAHDHGASFQENSDMGLEMQSASCIERMLPMEVESRQSGGTGKGGLVRPPKAAESAATLAVVWWPIGRPKPYPKNARKWSKSAVEKVAASIKALAGCNPLFAIAMTLS